MVRRFAAAAAAAGICLALAGAGTVAAQAAPATSRGSCTIGGTAVITPGLTSTKSAHTDYLSPSGGQGSGASISLTSCTGAPASSATVTGSLTSKNQTCTTGAAHGVIDYVWAGGAGTSKVKTTFKNIKGMTGKLTVTYKVTAGPLKGDTGTGTVTFTPKVGNCLTTPITQVSVGPSTVTV